MLHVVVSREAEEVSRVTQTTRHTLDRGDWTQLKTPIVARWGERASDAGTQRGACLSVSSGEPLPRPCLQKYNPDNANALIGRGAILR
jgi:hypothetical protein